MSLSNSVKLGIASAVCIFTALGIKIVYDLNTNEKQEIDVVPTIKKRTYVDGYDVETGKDPSGYYRNGYNDLGLDRSNKNKIYYSAKFKQIDEAKNKAYKLKDGGDKESALFQYGKIFDNLLKSLVMHRYGKVEHPTNEKYLKIIAEKGLLKEGNTFVDKLHDIRKYYNENKHEFDGLDLDNTSDFIIRTTDKLYYSVKESLEI